MLVGHRMLASRTPVNVNGISVDLSGWNPDDHSSRVANIIATNIALIALVGFFVSARILVRTFVIRKIFADDILILIGATFTIALSAVCIAATNAGIGTHVWGFATDVLFDKVKKCIQFLYVCQVLYQCAIAVTKISIISSYLRFIPEKRFHYVMHTVGAIVVSMGIIGVFVTIFQCSPVSAAWDFFDQKHKCINYIRYLYASSALNVATDLFLCISPLPYLWTLNMPRKQKVILCVLLTGGACACVACIVRMTFLKDTTSLDVTYAVVPSLDLSVVECSLGIICVSIPPLRPLAARIWPSEMMTKLRTGRSSANKSPMASLGMSRSSMKRPNSTLVDSGVECTGPYQELHPLGGGGNKGIELRMLREEAEEEGHIEEQRPQGR